MRKLLVVAFLLYDVVAIATRLNNYDYDDIDGSKRPAMDERRNWRKKALSKGLDNRREWDRQRYEYDSPRYNDEIESKTYNGIDGQREIDASPGYRYRKYEDAIDKMNLPSGIKSSEIIHAQSFLDKDAEKKPSLGMSCQRPHEKYESCFAGCASVTCDNPRDRMMPCYPFCEAGCVCVAPYVRDDRTHKCVLPDECTKGLKGIPDLGEDATT